MRMILTAVLLLAATAVTSMADGKMFWREKIPPTIPYQRALILFRDGIETLVLQSRYEIPKTGEKTTLGWVVPVPAVPEVASMPADVASHLFIYMSMSTSPHVTRITLTVFAVLFFGLAGLSLLTLSLCLISLIAPFPQGFKRNRGRLARYSLWGLLICFVMAIIIPSFASGRGSLGVDVIAEHRVGIYDVSVVRSDKADALVSWLNNHEFKFGEKDTATFESYVARGWCFVVATINSGANQAEREIVSEGLAAPLILRFPHAKPIYPVALTGTGDFETEILIYLASASKMSAGDRLTLRFAGPMREGRLEMLSAATEPTGFFDPKDMDYPYLCKFKDRLSPAQMREDIVFAAAEDERPYREHIVRW